MEKKSVSSGGGAGISTTDKNNHPKSLKGSSSDHDNPNFDYNSYIDDNASSSNAGGPSQTFRDTEIQEVEANHLMKIQSIASIINDPKRDTFYTQVKHFLT